MDARFSLTRYFLLATPLALLPLDAHAYIGPGGGLSAIGVFLALVVGVIAASFGFLWYPIKRLRSRLRKSKAAKQAPE